MAIETRHQKHCKRTGNKEARCNCKPSYRVAVYSGKQGTRRLKTFPSHAAALSFETSAKAGQRSSATGNTTLSEAAEALFEGMKLGTVLNRKREQYKASVIHGYETDFDNHIKEELGAMRLDRIERRHLQALADKKRSTPLAASTVRNILAPVFVIYRRALRDDLITVNPCEHLDLESRKGEKRIEVADPDHARKCVAALPIAIGATYGCALFAGLRVGEIAALQWEHIKWDEGVILVQSGFDQKKRILQGTKSRQWRRVPILSELRKLLINWQSHATESTLWVFPRRDGKPFTASSHRITAARHWKKKGLEPIGYHACRHTFVSICIDAGFNPKQIGSWIGHQSITTTMDTYGHLISDSEEGAIATLDAYLSKNQDKGAR